MDITPRRALVAIAVVSMLAAAVRTEADVLELKNGQVPTGKYLGGAKPGAEEPSVRSEEAAPTAGQ